MVVSGLVPAYDIYGHQHHRSPYHDKSMFNSVKPIWTNKPRVKTRTELSNVRHAQKIPHISYDLNGDGVVDHKDYFFARHFDEGGKGRLTKEEQKQAQEALGNGFADRFLMGLEKQGGKRPFAIWQKRGKVFTQDMAGLLSDTYPKHFNASIAPAHATRTACNQDRLRERAEAAMALKAKWDANNPSMIEEPDGRRMDEWVEHPTMQHIKARAEADHQHQRVKSGLYPCNTAINPEREHLENGLAYQENPEFQTRSQLLQTRKECMKQDLDAQRIRGEEEKVPPSVTRGHREAENYEFRRGPPNTMTQTQMDLSRKCERIEYDRTHFGEKLRELPRFSDQAHPFWTLTRCSSAPAGSKRPQPIELKPRPVHPKSAPAMRKEDPPVVVPTEEHQIYDTIVQSRCLGENTQKRWSADMLEGGRAKDQPRYFDNLPLTKTVPRDYVDLDRLSSFDCIRKGACRDHATAKHRNAKTTNHFGGPKSMFAEDNHETMTSMISVSRLQPSSQKEKSTTSMFSRVTFNPLADGQGARSASSNAKSGPPRPVRSASASVLTGSRGSRGVARPIRQKSYGTIERVEQKHEGTMLDRFAASRTTITAASKSPPETQQKNGASSSLGRPTTAPSHTQSASQLPSYGIRTAW